MKFELSGEETALLISALTVKVDKLKEQAALHREVGMPKWAEAALEEAARCVQLKERLFL